VFSDLDFNLTQIRIWPIRCAQLLLHQLANRVPTTQIAKNGIETFTWCSSHSENGSRFVGFYRTCSTLLNFGIMLTPNNTAFPINHAERNSIQFSTLQTFILATKS
jgi:hypothetical protein